MTARPRATLPGSRTAAVAALLVVAAGLAACRRDGGIDGGGALVRSGRFGSLRDFVLIERLEHGRVLPLFVDRFEVTRGDWIEFAATPAGRAVDAAVAALDGDPALPVGMVDLQQARAFARWRFARLPRREEWAAAVGDGRYRFPWGSKADATRANTGELGLGEPVPVGTFEAGRRAGGNFPYDLIGNVSEWTESVAAGWTASQLDPVASLQVGRERVLRTPALAVWLGPGGLVPLPWAVAAAGRGVPREVVGADFLAPMASVLEAVPAEDRRLRTGLRLVATPAELLAALLAADGSPRAGDLEQVRRFVRRDQHRAALAEAWPLVAAGYRADSALHRLLRDELAR
ncbi:MAG: SUMF1/EgtB/PvdO family nonheme iron enzyme [Planctomycetes bacterium]|nr:SUMF1/EgtB/PvdO family nonheme iron enzyme [Planctomycetota bacterium]